MSKRMLITTIIIAIIVFITAPREFLYPKTLSINEALELLKKTGKFEGTYHYIDKHYNGIYGKGEWYYEFRIRGENDSFYIFHVYTQSGEIYLIGQSPGIIKLPKPN